MKPKCQLLYHAKLQIFYMWAMQEARMMTNDGLLVSLRVRASLKWSPCRLWYSQATDLTLHGIRDVAWGVEADGGVVGWADHLMRVIDVRCRHKRLSFPVVSNANRFKFLYGGIECKVTIKSIRRLMMWSEMANIILWNHFKTIFQTCFSASKFILYGWAWPSSTTRGDHSLDSFLEV